MPRWLVALLCASCAPSPCARPGAGIKAEPGKLAPEPTPAVAGEILLHNGSEGPIEIREALGPSMDMALIDEEGRLAPMSSWRRLTAASVPATPRR